VEVGDIRDSKKKRSFSMPDHFENPFLTIPEAADLLRVKRRTLDNLRWNGGGPRFRRHGGRIVYHRDELLAWSEQRRARSREEGRALPHRSIGDAGPRHLPAGGPPAGHLAPSFEPQP
jgi:hypothetical protein